MYRVWNIINIPNQPDFYPVLSPAEGKRLIDRLANEQLQNPRIGSNAFGLEVFEDDEWTEWYDEQGSNVDEAFSG